jgi:alpha-beta hydrolase superfamily lysophospholipase/SAM-dependent methyltransferase
MKMTQETMKSSDGVELFYRAWMPDYPPRRAIVLFHRGHEHSGRWQGTVEALCLDDFAFFAWDQRGHGRSPGDRGYAKNLSVIVKDADCFCRHISEKYSIAFEDLAVISHSVGAVIAAAWAHDFGPPIRALVLAAPAFRVKLYVPLAIPALRLKQKLVSRGVVKSYVKAGVLTHDSQQAQAYRSDPLIFRQIAVNILLDLNDTGGRLIADAGAITTPTLILSAGSDWVVTLAAQRRFFRRLGSSVKQMETYPGFYHAIFHERDRHLVTDRIKAFILEAFAKPPQNCDLLQADKGGFTRTEYDLLRGPGAWYWPLVRRGLATFGRLSRGISLGWRSGFDSGVTLDYIYENKPRGLTPVGRCIDYFYLNSIGWRGIRVRRENLRAALRDLIEQTHREARPVRILDIASGPGRYILETLRDLADIPFTAVLRDYRQENLDAAASLAAEWKISNVQFVLGDAFDRSSLADIDPRPTIAVVSGLYELFPENDGVLRSLYGLADAMESGGHLIYTCQPWHPQVEFIARALTNREGKPWIMRRRSQAEMDALIRAAGFEKISQKIDPWGIFTVSAALRLPPNPPP